MSNQVMAGKNMLSKKADVFTFDKTYEDHISRIYRIIDELKGIGYSEKKINQWMLNFCQKRR